MNDFYDANILYDAGTKAMNGSKFKKSTQLFEMNHLLNTAKIRRELMEHTYRPDPGQKFIIKERGKTRYITSNTMKDKTVNHVLCDNVLTPSIEPYLIYDNGASQKGKGVSFHRKRFEAHLHQYYMQNHTNEGYILLVDFSGYYANIPHDKCREILTSFMDRAELDPETVETAKEILDKVFQSFELDVSRFSDEEVEAMMRTKIDPLMNVGADPKQLTGKKFLRKGVDIGSQPSQNIGIAYPYTVDNYAKIVRGVHGYGRYTDDFYAIHQSKEFLHDLLRGLTESAEALGLIINPKKTRICKLSRPFSHLQRSYQLTSTGAVKIKISSKAVTRERRKLKAYKRLLDAGRMEYEDIENSFKGWLGGNWKVMTHQQIYNLNALYVELFGRSISWKKKHSKLCWLMAHPSKGWASTATTSSAPRS